MCTLSTSRDSQRPFEVAVATAVDVADVAPVPSWSIPSPFLVLPLLPGPVFESPLSFSVVNRAVGLKRREQVARDNKGASASGAGAGRGIGRSGSRWRLR